MPSPSKHSYTKSAMTSESYAGNRGKTALLHAIELLFYIKSTEFKKFHPSFLTPSAEEFLDYIQSRYRKHFIQITLRHRRPLYTAATASPKPPVLFKQFIAFIHAPAAASSFQSLIGCLYIINESLALYTTIKSALSLSSLSSPSANWQGTFCSNAFFDEFTAPVFWLLEHKMPSCFSYRHDLLVKMTQAISKKCDALLSAMPSATGTGTGTGTGTAASTVANQDAKSNMLETLGLQFTHAFQTVMSTEPYYTMYFTTPLSFLFGSRGGVVCCRDFCETFIKKYSESLIM
jgi:hypothetical protein